MGIEHKNIKRFHVFLASPGDMEDERRMVREFFDGYNKRTANPIDLDFKLIDWENYSSSGVGRPQALINEQVLEHYGSSLVLVIGLLGQRFGTPTGEHESGTEEEFDLALQYRQQREGWPEVKWFFRSNWGSKGAPKGSRALLEAAKQQEKVEAFKEKLISGKPQLYYKEFESTAEFAQLIRADLELWLNHRERPWHKAGVERSERSQTLTTERPFLTTWLKLLATDCARLPLEILDARQGLNKNVDPIRLPDVFVPLKASAPPKAWREKDGGALHLTRELMEGEREEAKPLMDLLGEQLLSVVLGDPGSGKSALVNQLTWLALNPDRRNGLPGNFPGRLPVRVVLRGVEVPDQAERGEANWIWKALQDEIREKLSKSQNAGEQAEAVVKAIKYQFMNGPGGLMLLDGLDEVPTVGQRRFKILQAVKDLVASLPNTTPVILTARPYAYTDPRWRLREFEPFFLTPFDQDQRKAFIAHWYQAAGS